MHITILNVLTSNYYLTTQNKQDKTILQSKQPINSIEIYRKGLFACLANKDTLT